jgi:hypothetical protein
MSRVAMNGAVPRRSKRGCRRALLQFFLLASGVSRAAALDWHEPWAEIHDAHAARTRSDEYAWRLFMALNWPADAASRGPDPAARFGADRPVVWETWLSAGSVYLDDGGDPGPWLPRRDAEQVSERRFESPSPAERRNLRHVVAGVMVPLANPLQDARRLTEIHMNRATFEFIRARSLYNMDGQLQAYAAGNAVSFPYGAAEVKAKWRPIGETERARYHTLEVSLADGTRRLYGLTGLHIASKDLPHWFWATFEQVDNPGLADNEGWKLPSRDRFACGNERADCNRAPLHIGLKGTVWQYYRLRGTLTRYTDARGEPQRLANSELESGMQSSASCMTCHSRATIGLVGGAPVHLPIFAEPEDAEQDSLRRRGFIGTPSAAWFMPEAGNGRPRFQQLDFVWSLTKAQRVAH